MNHFLDKLLTQQDFTEQESYLLFQALDKASVEQQAAGLALLQTLPTRAEQLKGAREYLLEYSEKIVCPYDIVDIVGTGGDRAGTFNISTAASLLVSSCGVYVAKHGGRSVTSPSGSRDVLGALKIPLPKQQSEILAQLRKYQFVHLASGAFNTKLDHFRSLRKNLGIPSIFNILAPLMNPLHPKRMVLGVYKKELMLPIITVLQKIGLVHAMVIHSYDQLDEISLSAPTYVSELKNGKIQHYTIKPEDFGFERTNLQSVQGASPEENADIIQKILSNELKGPKQDIVILNAAAGLVVAGKVPDFTSGVKMAKEAILSEKAKELIKKLQFSNASFLDKLRPFVNNRVANIQVPTTLPKNELDFCQLFNPKNNPVFISEIKFASPSKGILYTGPLNHDQIAQSYIQHKTHALSVLSEPHFFKGNIGYIKSIRDTNSQIPILCKDFILSEKQIAEALLNGANAVLLIVAFLEKNRLKQLYDYAQSLNLTPLIEVHDKTELEIALELKPKLIGINNRNLNTLEINLNTSRTLIKHIPKNILTICESGISRYADIQEMTQLGFNGFLIGSQLMKHPNPGIALKSLIEDEQHES